MISAVHIQNFQSHEDTKVDFSNGVNVIIGKSDNGKSGLLRAIDWVHTNRPLGEGFRSDWGGTTSVKIFYTSGDTVERKKGKGINCYVLNGSELKAFGHEPPEEVRKVFQLNREVNVQTQIDPFFLLQSSSGDVARHLNQVANLDKIDSTGKNLDNHIRSIKRQMQRNEEDKQQLEQDLEKYKDVGLIEDWLNKATKTEEQIQKLSDEIQRIEKLRQEILACRKRVKILKGKGVCGKTLDNAIKCAKQIKTNKKDIEDIQYLIDSAENAKSRLETHRTGLLDASILDEAIKAAQGVDSCTREKLRIMGMVESIEESQSLCRQYQKTQKLIDKELSKHTKKKCPLCGRS